MYQIFPEGTWGVFSKFMGIPKYKELGMKGPSLGWNPGSLATLFSLLEPEGQPFIM